ncbi:hypothetical protein HUT06_41870 [Actinomadura sp. NAK00032]|uniref:hypothetical protein n=1 Tax=Actinomadura sp. NAK00032 TaxID=2742128 RepID=UPI0015900D38|nr:hypothetical protein [Actinomadura sp. NAK00032]QKW39776.1 hypothetical protein HUT06_41870 [Actinomadura sp. NAK00032]
MDRSNRAMCSPICSGVHPRSFSSVSPTPLEMSASSMSVAVSTSSVIRSARDAKCR